jgi:hypothetical protein
MRRCKEDNESSTGKYKESYLPSWSEYIARELSAKELLSRCAHLVWGNME